MKKRFKKPNNLYAIRKSREFLKTSTSTTIETWEFKKPLTSILLTLPTFANLFLLSSVSGISPTLGFLALVLGAMSVVLLIWRLERSPLVVRGFSLPIDVLKKQISQTITYLSKRILLPATIIPHRNISVKFIQSVPTISQKELPKNRGIRNIFYLHFSLEKNKLEPFTLSWT